MAENYPENLQKSPNFRAGPEFLNALYFCINQLDKLIMPELIKLLKTHTDLKITFVGTAQRLIAHEKQALHRKLLIEYNKQMELFIENVKTVHGISSKQLSFMRVVEDIALAKFDDLDTDIEFPLVADGTHLNWPVKDDIYPGQVTLQAPAQLAVNNILLNFHCSGNFEVFGPNDCCE